MSAWERKRFLVWGKTRPELSKSYKEVVCTGGVFEDTKKLVRLYPIPLRYMDGHNSFQKYQWAEADVKKAPGDRRPESYRIRYNGIELKEIVPTDGGNWDKRAFWILGEQNLCSSLEELRERQKIDGTSLRLVKPRKVHDITAHRLSMDEQLDFVKRWKLITAQGDLPLDEHGREIEPLAPPDFKFLISFSCEDNRCQKLHHLSVLDWEVDALYFNCRSRGDSDLEARDKTIDKLFKICSPQNDFYFFLGNIATHPQVFCIVGLWYPRRKQQMALF